MSSDKPDPILQQIPLIVTPNRFSNTKAVTLPFEYSSDLQAPKLQSSQIAGQIESNIALLNSAKEKLPQLQEKDIYKKWESQTLNSIAPGFFDQQLVPKR